VPAFWAGDQLVDFSRDDGLPSVIPAAISLGMSGVGYTHSDTGGYTTVAWVKRSKECLLRWMELSAFSPVFRTHEGNRPESNVQFDADSETLAQLARMSEVFTALKPYHAAAARDYAERGLPAVRHPYLHYEAEAELHERAYQYLYGRDLLVAPALKARQELTELRLPSDDWVHLWSSRSFKGGSVTVDSPLGFPAVFYRAASPFAPLFDTVRRNARRV
jgi:alpha-glucosidase